MTPANDSTDRARRAIEDKIKRLEAQIEALKQRKVRKLQRRDPALRHLKAAVHSLDKALATSDDHAARQALGEARSTLAACLAIVGMAPVAANGAVRGRSGGVTEDTLLAYVRSHPGSRGEEIAQALGSTSAAVRPIMKGLMGQGLVRAEGQARATSYRAV